MPHYADGSPAQVGDKVIGKPYNVKDADGSPRTIVGELIQITPGSESCNCVVAFLEEVKLDPFNSGTLALLAYPTYSEGQTIIRYFRAATDYGETRAFSKVE